MKVLLILFFFLASLSPASAQTRSDRNRRIPPKPVQVAPTPTPSCNLTLGQAPEIRGLRLGMTLEEFLQTFPRVVTSYNPKPTPNEVGITGDIEVRPYHATDSSKFKGIDYIRVGFLDERMSFMEVRYDDSTNLRNARECTSKLTELTGLPNEWVFTSQVTGLMKCNGFIVEARVLPTSIVTFVTLSMFDTNAAQTVQKRKAELEEKKRREFKP